jgi:hypothetical protein
MNHERKKNQHTKNNYRENTFTLSLKFLSDIRKYLIQDVLFLIFQTRWKISSNDMGFMFSLNATNSYASM